MLVSACDDSFLIEGDNGIVTTEIDIENFTEIVLNIDAEVIINDSSYSHSNIIIEAQKLIADNINTQVIDNQWVIKYSQSVGEHLPVKIYINQTSLKKITLNTSGTIIENSRNSDSTFIELEGDGIIELSGYSKYQEIRVLGNGTYKAFGLESDICEAYIGGTGSGEIFVNDSLFVDIRGAGMLYYKGNPAIEKVIHGTGKLINAN